MTSNAELRTGDFAPGGRPNEMLFSLSRSFIWSDALACMCWWTKCISHWWWSSVGGVECDTTWQNTHTHATTHRKRYHTIDRWMTKSMTIFPFRNGNGAASVDGNVKHVSTSTMPTTNTFPIRFCHANGCQRRNHSPSFHSIAVQFEFAPIYFAGGLNANENPNAVRMSMAAIFLRQKGSTRCRCAHENLFLPFDKSRIVWVCLYCICQ